MSLQAQVDERLQQIARGHEFSVLQAPGAEQAFREILRVRPETVIVQVDSLPGEVFDLIRFIANAGQAIALIAFASVHSDETECAVRRAGAMWYVPDIESGCIDEILKTVRSGRN